MFGEPRNPSNRVHGVRGRTSTPATDAAGVYGQATANSGATAGVLGETDSGEFASTGVKGVATNGAGSARGVEGVARGSDGVGVSTKAPDGGLALFANASSGNAITANAPVTVNSQTDTDELSVQTHGMLAYRTSNQTISSGSTEAVVFDTVKRDDFGAYTESSGVYQIPADGDYLVEWQVAWSSTFSSDQVSYKLRVDFSSGSPGFAATTTADGDVVRNFSKPLYDATAGEQVDVAVYQQTGSSADVEGSPRHNTYLSVRKIG